MSDPLSVALKLDRLQRDLDGAARRRILLAGGQAAKQSILDTYRSAMGGDLALSKWRNSTVSVGYDVAGDTVVIRPRDRRGGAVLRVLEDGAGPHRITRKKRSRRRGRGRPSLKIGGQFVGRSVLHKGTKAKHVWTRAKVTATPLARRAMREEFHRTVVSYFGG